MQPRRCPLPKARVGTLELCWESFGEGEPLLLIMGIGAQLLLWDEAFCLELAGHGYRVVRFDNRDIGQSTWLDHLGVQDVRPMIGRRLVGLPITPVPYTLEDMAGDVVGLLDALDIPRAHIVGASMGGMIAQTVAIHHPLRMRSMTSIMSTTGDRRHTISDPKAILALFSGKPPKNAKEAGEASVRIMRSLSSPVMPLDEETARRVGRACFERGSHPQGFLRQFTAILASGSRRRALRNVTMPSLVIHGDRDPLIPIRGGRATAAAIPGARFHAVKGMGHALPREAWPELVRTITNHLKRHPLP